MDCGKQSVLCTCRPEVNQRISKAAHIKELNSEIDKLKEELFATREKNGVYLPAEHWESQQVKLLLHPDLLPSRQPCIPESFCVLPSGFLVCLHAA